MSKLGDVVFCVDCDRVRTARADGVAAGYGSALDAPPRRMANKRDANGDPLCAACLDARHDSRHAEFMLNEGRAPVLAQAHGAVAGHGTASALRGGAVSNHAADPESAVTRISPYIRIVRSRGPIEEAAPPPPKKSKPSARDREPQVARAPRPASRRLERQFILLAVEMGFLRAQALLDQLDVSSRKVAGRAARVAKPKPARKKNKARSR
jgi:hypothetical protein